MTRVLIATTNLGKLGEFRELLEGAAQVVSLKDMHALGQKPQEIEETGLTYYENALIKALRWSEAFRLPVLSDDSGIEVDVLDGKPGVLSARFGGEVPWMERWQKLVDAARTADPNQERWTARFRCVLCYAPQSGTPVFFEGVCEGWLLPKAVGSQGFGYDPIFYSKEARQPFGLLSSEEKNQFSHRAHAVSDFKKILKRS